jgi:hypothetical protein
MISTVLDSAPAGVLGTGSVDVRPRSCAAVRPSLLGVALAATRTGEPATGLPTADAGMPPIVRGWTGAVPASAFHTPQYQLPNDGTTPLGNHSSSRPPS